MNPTTDFIKEALFYERLQNSEVKCNLCAYRCSIASGKTGKCIVRKNVDGRLYSNVYGRPCAVVVDPIERRPFFHFRPGSQVLTLATVGCNFKCNFCVNSEISQGKKVLEEFVSPEQIVKTALVYNCDGICFAYTEPTIFLEYELDVSRIAKERGLFCTMITNGYMTQEALKETAPLMDAIFVNLKYSGNKEQMQKFASVNDPAPIFDFIKMVSDSKIHLELSDLIMPDHDFESFKKLVSWIRDDVSVNTPFHLLQFHPAYKMQNLAATSMEKLIVMKKYAEKFLNFVYVSNLPLTEHSNTICPRCKNIVIQRLGFVAVKIVLNGSLCRYCGKKILDSSMMLASQ